MTDWNFADVWETVADTVPDAPAFIHGERRLTWGETEGRANGVARALLESGVAHQDKVAHYLYNGPEYLESTFGILKAGLVPVNTNYRYTDDELVYLWDNADAVAVIFHGAFVERITGIRSRVPTVRSWLWVDDGSGECPSWATPYEAAATSGADRSAPPWGRSGDDLYLLYTGGTTGMPKGVMWRQDDLFCRLNAGNFLRVPEDGGLEGVRKAIVGAGPVHLPACPLMHGTGGFTSMAAMTIAGCVVTLTGRRFEPTELLDTIDRDNVNTVAIVGDAFAKPILAALDEHPGRWRLSTLLAFVSSGVMWSEETKRGLLTHHPTLMLIDAFSSSEALGMGSSVSSGTAAEHTARFTLSPDVRVLDPESGKDVTPGSGEVGVLALGGRNPLGYYKDADKSASTFKVIDGVRYSVPGDFATVDADGAIQLLGRGSVVINTGGEKVFPEEVEEVLKRHPTVRDAVAVGIPDDRFGQAVAAVVELRPGAEATERELVDHVRGHLAAYKAPRRVRFIDTIGRSPAGKVDYARHRAETTEWATTPV
ncbi:MAG TPA: acyl-CoA synthetase [Acidimicrobiales bacterium]|nr:acyl-CoA synthetase [Acidimicrobiales bacterium]